MGKSFTMRQVLGWAGLILCGVLYSSIVLSIIVILALGLTFGDCFTDARCIAIHRVTHYVVMVGVPCSLALYVWGLIWIFGRGRRWLSQAGPSGNLRQRP
jgi:hypothetical protein